MIVSQLLLAILYYYLNHLILLLIVEWKIESSSTANNTITTVTSAITENCAHAAKSIIAATISRLPVSQSVILHNVDVQVTQLFIQVFSQLLIIVFMMMRVCRYSHS